jgi:hypothetical protein
MKLSRANPAVVDGRSLLPVQLGIGRRSHHNQATVHERNKLVRNCFGVLRVAEPYTPGHLAPTRRILA